VGGLSAYTNNLLSNAFKYTPQKGTIEVDIREDEKEIILEISDTGSGISPKSLPAHFRQVL
jgi:signal transduction histidine kinase